MGVDDLFEIATVCDVSDSCDQLGVPCARTGQIRPVYPGCPPFAGVVSTVRLRPGQSMQLASLVKVFEETGNDAILVDLGGRTDVQCWGSLLAEAAMIHGVRAALVNGAARDVGQLGRLGFPTFARGIHPASMRGRLAMVETECDVVIDGQPVSPGWAVAADSNGAIFFPREHAGKVFALAKEIATAERRLLEKAHEASESAATARRMLLS